MTKVVINRCFGGFGLSNKALRRWAEISGGPTPGWREIDRTDPILVQVVEELGSEANGSFSKLEIVELARGTRYRITEYDGSEDVETAESIDWSIA